MSIVKWTKTALDDLDGIKEYIARDSVHCAEKLEDDAFAAADNLELFPEKGRIVPERNDPDFRELNPVPPLCPFAQVSATQDNQE